MKYKNILVQGGTIFSVYEYTFNLNITIFHYTLHIRLYDTLDS